MVLTRPLRSRFARVPLLVSTLTFLPLALKLWVFPFAVTLDVPPAGAAPLLAEAPAALPPAAVPPPALALAAAPPLAPVVAPALAPAAPPGLAAAEVPGL